MNKKLENTYKECTNCHQSSDGKRTCKRCKNKRVIEWVIKDGELPKKENKYLCCITFGNVTFYREHWFNGEKFSTADESCITHWADISRLAPTEE